MKMKEILVRRVMPLFMVTLMSLTILMPAASAVSQKDINNLKEQATSLNGKKNDLKKKLAALGDDKSKAVEQKSLLDQQCEVLQGEIDNISAQIREYDKLIAETTAEIAENEAQEAEQYELFCKRVRAMEENGKVSYWEMLFKAKSFSDLLSRIDFINEVMDYDKRVMEELQELRRQLAEKRTSLEESKAGQVEAKKALDARRAELQTQLDAANALVKKIRSEEGEYANAIQAYEKEEDDIQAKIVRLSKELEAQNNKGGGGNANTNVITSQMGKNGYMWPVKNSRKITSPYGVRIHPLTGKKRKHNGVDIGGVGFTSEVLASKAGTVIVSQRSNSYGNYIVVDHGPGNTTLYAHLSKRLVSAGQKVKQGQVLGITGSTGNSNGPHLHFEVTEGGSRVDPLQYLTGYVKVW